MTGVQHIPGQTFHGRRGTTRNAFRYGVDYVLFDAENAGPLPRGFAWNGAGLWSVHDSDHGGDPGQGRGAAWVRDVLATQGIDPGGAVYLLTQPRVLGHVFNPVSFWLCHDPAGALRVVIAEVTNTFGDRHSYLCHHDDLRPISGRDKLASRKIFHVSPFQPIDGDYVFQFDIRDDALRIVITLSHGAGGVVATLEGPRQALTLKTMVAAVLRRPFGARRVLALIHWQALKLWLKGARYRTRPQPPADEVSR